MGKACTRNCGFCDIDFSRNPKALEEDEPARVADSVKQLGLKHVVITMVARDDLEDGGASHLAKIIQAIKKDTPDSTIEVLTSDFSGNLEALQVILDAEPNIFNHNIETVRELTPRVRHKATYDRSLRVLKYVKEHSSIITKSGIMVGLGETEEQVQEALQDLKEAGVSIVTMGQYLQPNRHKLLVKSFVTPEQFKRYEERGKEIGIPHMYCGPFVRSSYNAAEVFKQI
jgi:lipoic acid synthetase